MKKYNFSMESVLEWRENLEKTSMEKFALIQNELIHEKSILTSLTLEHQSLKDKGLSYKNINELRQMQLYKQTLEDRIDFQNQVIYRKSKELEEIRIELISAQKDRKVMEKLKERDFSNYQEDLRASEQKDLDEMAVLKYKKVVN